MKQLKEALINKSNINHSKRYFREITKKSDLRDGDMCLQGDGSFGVYIEKFGRKEADKYRLTENRVPIFLFFEKDDRWLKFSVTYLTEDLKDKTNDKNYDIIKVLRGVCDPKLIEDPDKLEKFLVNFTAFDKYFKD